MIEIVGWSGSLFYLFSQVYKSMLSGVKHRYAIFNMVASFLVVVYSFLISSYQPVAINIVWFLLSFIYSRNIFSVSCENKVGFYSFVFLILLLVLFVVVFFYGGGAVYTLSWVSFLMYSGSYFMYLFLGL